MFDMPVRYHQLADSPDTIFIIDADYRLYRLNVRRNELTFILDISHELMLKGMPSGVIEINGNYLLSFKTSGVVRLKYEAKARKWLDEELDIKSGVFGMIKDRYQSLVWIATDGLGVYTYCDAPYDIRSYNYSPADPEYIVTVPLFDKVTFDLHGNPFTIHKRGNGHKINNITYGGKEIDGYFIEHSLLQQGKTLEIHVE